MKKFLRVTYIYFYAILFSCGVDVFGDEPCLDDTWDIVLATCVKAEFEREGHNVLYTFEVDETLRGNQKKNFQIKGDAFFPKTVVQEVSSFELHTDENFWKLNFFRTDTEFSEVRLSFIVGWSYLVFMNEPYRLGGFEVVHSKNDKWYIHWKKKVKDGADNDNEIRIGAQWGQACVFLDELSEGDSVDTMIYGKILKCIHNNENMTNEDLKKKIREILDSKKTS